MGESTMSSSPGQGREVSVNGSATSNNVEEKPRLSEHEKKANHIASGMVTSHFTPAAWRMGANSFFTEQKRRQAIREGFDRLTELVPGLEGQGRSESIVLNKTVAYMRQQLEERAQLVAQIERMGGKVDDGFRK